jgi:hypothetical protein
MKGPKLPDLASASQAVPGPFGQGLDKTSLDEMQWRVERTISAKLAVSGHWVKMPMVMLLSHCRHDADWETRDEASGVLGYLLPIVIPNRFSGDWHRHLGIWNWRGQAPMTSLPLGRYLSYAIIPPRVTCKVWRRTSTSPQFNGNGHPMAPFPLAPNSRTREGSQGLR